MSALINFAAFLGVFQFICVWMWFIERWDGSELEGEQ